VSNALLIARRELSSYLRSWLGPAIVSGALLIEGILFYWIGLGQKLLSAEVLQQFFYNTSGVTMVAALFLSMRLLAEERQTGTLVLLNTSPVSDRDIVIGKFLGAFTVLAVTVLLSVYMPAWLFVHGKVAIGHMVVGYLGLLLLGGSVVAIGLFGSTLARSQVVAVIVGGALLAVMILLWLVAKASEPPLNEYLSRLALHHENFRPFMQGILEPTRVVYYLIVTYAFLFASTKVLEARRWR
jgi:ABC-2 type transport system permease protein